MNPFLLPAGATYSRRSRKPVVAVVTTAIVLGAGGVGYAAWSVTAGGSSQATSGQAVASVVTPAAPVDTLFPGGSTPLYFTVSNDNDFPVTYDTVTFGAVSVDDATACPATNVEIAQSSVTVSVSVPANSTSTVQAPAAAISMLTTAADGCQGRTFTVATTLTGVSG